MTFSEKRDLRLLLSFSFASSDVTNLGVIRDRNLDVNRSVMSYVCAGIFINTDVKFCWIWYPAYNTLQIKYKSHQCAGVYIRCGHMTNIYFEVDSRDGLPVSLVIHHCWTSLKLGEYCETGPLLMKKESNFRNLRSILIYIYKSSDFKISNLLAYRNWLNISTIFSW